MSCSDNGGMIITVHRQAAATAADTLIESVIESGHIGNRLVEEINALRKNNPSNSSGIVRRQSLDIVDCLESASIDNNGCVKSLDIDSIALVSRHQSSSALDKSSARGVNVTTNYYYQLVDVSRIAGVIESVQVRLTAQPTATFLVCHEVGGLGP